jgi:hypothetical protein
VGSVAAGRQQAGTAKLAGIFWSTSFYLFEHKQPQINQTQQLIKDFHSKPLVNRN